MVNAARISPRGTAGTSGVKPKTYRRPPSLTEQERRREWGKRWGRLIRERYLLLLEGME